MIGLAHYSSERDISGVTTWLLDFMRFLRVKGEDVALNLHHVGHDAGKASILGPAQELGVKVTCRTRPKWTHEAVRDNLEFLNLHRPSVFLPQCVPAHFFAALLASLQGVPYGLTLHSDDPDYWALLDGCAPPASRGCVVAVSEAIATEARTLKPNSPVHMIPYGVALTGLTAKWIPEHFRVVYSGRMVERQKRVSLVVETLIRFCNACPWGEAVLIGDGQEYSRLREQVLAANLSSRIRFTGRLQPGDVASHLAAAHAVLLMSDFEGLPVAMLEGMSHGCVPVARHLRSGIPELIKHKQTGLIVSDAPQEAAQVLAGLASDREEWERLSLNARRLIQDGYGQEACFEMWWKLIQQLQMSSKPQYPLNVPSRPAMPPFDTRLAALDSRQPPLLKRGYFKVRRLAGKVLRGLRLR
jgi:colanic acid/amylovoran biosynthesis glycosyltransferase